MNYMLIKIGYFKIPSSGKGCFININTVLVDTGRPEFYSIVSCTLGNKLCHRENAKRFCEWEESLTML